MKKKNTSLKIENKKLLHFYYKQGFSIMAAVICMNIAVAQTSTTDIAQQEYYRPLVNAPIIKMPEEVTITGSVKDEEGNPLSNATLHTSSGENYFTDNNGGFSFKLKKEQVKSQSIFVSYDGLVTATRSYNPVMANTDYTIVLYKPKVCCNIKNPDSAGIKPVTVYFKNKSSYLSEETKKELDKISNSLKENPIKTVIVTAHTGTNKSLLIITKGRLDAIKKYLIEQKGISADRITTEKAIDDINNNRVDIKLQ